MQLPAAQAFRDAESYAATKTHEPTHWTKNRSRLDRFRGELGAAFLGGDFGISTEPLEAPLVPGPLTGATA